MQSMDTLCVVRDANPPTMLSGRQLHAVYKLAVAVNRLDVHSWASLVRAIFWPNLVRASSERSAGLGASRGVCYTTDAAATDARSDCLVSSCIEKDVSSQSAPSVTPSGKL